MRPLLRPTELLLPTVPVASIAWGCASPGRSGSGRATTRVRGIRAATVAGCTIRVPPGKGLVDFL